MGAGCGAGGALLAYLWACPLGAGGRLSGLQDLPEVGSGPLVVCSFLLPALLLCLWCIGLKYAFIWLFKGVFSAVWAFRVGLCCLGALRGLCGFCARVELGGLKDCGVFAFILSFCPFVFLSCPAFVLLACFASWLASLLGFCSWSLGLLVLWLLVFFPFRTASDIKRRGAYCVPSCGVLLVGC